MRPDFALITVRLTPICLGLAAGLTAAPQIALAAPAPAAAAPSKLTPKDNALNAVRSGLKSADFTARGMAYRGLVFDKGNKDLKKTLEDGTTDPQWVVRAGVAYALHATGNPMWRKVIHDALTMPVLSPLEVLPIIEELPEKDAVSVLLEVLADKEHDQHDKIVAGLITRNRALLSPFLVAALASKEALVSGAAQKALKKLDPVLQGKTLDALAKAQAANDVVTKLLLDIAQTTDERLAVPYLAFAKTKDAAILDRIVVMRALHGDRSVGKALIALAIRSKDKAQLEALSAYRRIADKDDAAGLKPILAQGPNPDILFQVYEILARSGDRSMQREAQTLADSTDVDVRATGVFYLGWVGGAGRISEMHKYLADGIPGVRIAAARVLAHISSPISVAPLKEAMEAERDERVRLELIKALAGIKHKDAYQALVFFTRERDPVVRRIVVRALAESGDNTVRGGLQNALNDNDVHIRAEAVRGFILSDVAKAADVWKRSLRWLPRGVVLELTRELNKTMEGFLELALSDAGRDDNAVLVREEALIALRLLPEAEQRILFKLLDATDDEDLKIRLLRQLLDMDKDKVAVAVKSTALQSGVRARVAAIRMLSKLKGDKEVPELLNRFMEEPDERLRVAAALTLLGG
ncbi:MAG: HEAT repeat domain-containing protein [Deltaproteobacteria bacterium]|nr:HEAT repeat domain-containing protein [Deltaproteobacteria bacterium]